MVREKAKYLYAHFKEPDGSCSVCSDLVVYYNNLNEVYRILIEHKNDDHNVDPVAEAILIALYALLIVVGILANLIVSFVVARRPQMHTARNLYIVNLTVSDMTLCLVCMPFTLVNILRRAWTLGIVLCKLVPALQGTNIMVSIGTITVIALDRYFTIVRGQDSATTRRRVIISIALVWFFSFLATLPVVFFQIIIFNLFKYYCQNDIVRLCCPNINSK
uniref:G_PROTEIN_RECEP_F1_2 domain-containing protein n=1 Tax=Rhodnius prolixus TaxID=13249 RepID=T1HVS0_RHOPR